MDTSNQQPASGQVDSDLPPSNSWRDRMGDGWLRVFVFDHWFGIATLLFFALILFMGLFLTKIWTATPEWITPSLKISGLDMAQGWSMARRAVATAHEGNLNEAMLTWRSASVHNPGNPKIARDMITAINSLPKPDRRYTALGYDRCIWLLKLTQTNLNDLTLVTHFLRKYEVEELVLQMTSTLTNSLPTDLASDILVASFHRGQMKRFGTVWENHQTEFTKNSTLVLYRLAWDAGWGPLSGMQVARRRMIDLQAQTTGDDAIVLRRLQLYLSSQLNDITQFRTSLDWLIDHHVDRVGDHVNFWRLLIRSGRRSEARDLARQFSRPPETVADAIGIGSMFVDLQLPTVAIDFALAQLKDYPFSSELWMLIADQRIELKSWSELRQTAVAMRNEPALQGKMTGVSSFLEGVVNLRNNDPESAAKKFAEAAKGRFSRPGEALMISERLLKLGYPAPASELMRSLESEYSNDISFWFQLTTAAYESRQMDVMVRAAKKTYSLGTNQPIHINNYAAVLIATRTNPEEAVKLTFRLILHSPHNRDYQINHSLALVQTGRLDEAEKILKAFNPANLNPVEESSIALAWFEYNVRKGDKERAKEMASRIDVSHLMEPQALWVKEQIKKL